MLALDDEALRTAIARVAPDSRHPGRHTLHDVVERNFSALSMLQEKHAPLQFAYRFEANRTSAILDAAHRAGVYASVVNGEELETARYAGFHGRTIYNGPLPAWRVDDEPTFVFSDSIEAFIDNVARLPRSLVGVRFRPKGIDSRFGITRSQIPAFLEHLRESGCTETGVAFHIRPQDYGPRTWREITVESLAFAADIEQESGARVVCFDVGGGRTPSAFDRSVSAGDFTWLVKSTRRRLPHVHTIIAEPGQAVVAPTQILVAPVLERRRTNAHVDLVVDVGAREMAQLSATPHRLFAQVRNEIVRLLRGKNRILGCSSLEGDFLSRSVDLPEPVDAIEAIIVGDVGSYDATAWYPTALTAR